MNISEDLLRYREAATERAVHKEIQGAVFISVLALIGVIGNSILIDVYANTRKKVLSTYFIIILGSIDLSICFIVIPLRATFMFVPVPTAACSFYLAVAYVSVSCSIYLFLLIAIDRYQSVCRLGQPLLTVKHLKFLLANMIVSIIFILVITHLYLQGHVDIIDGNQSVSLLMRENFPCYVNSMLNHPKRQWDSRYKLHFTLAIFFTVFMAGVSCLYVRIFKTLKQIDAFRRRSKGTVHPWTPNKNDLNVTKLVARPCYIHTLNVVPKNCTNASDADQEDNGNSSKNKEKSERSRESDSTTFGKGLVKRIGNEEFNEKCNRTDVVIIKREDRNLVVESTSDDAEFPKQQTQFDIGPNDNTADTPKLRIAYELPNHSNALGNNESCTNDVKGNDSHAVDIPRQTAFFHFDPAKEIILYVNNEDDQIKRNSINKPYRVKECREQKSVPRTTATKERPRRFRSSRLRRSITSREEEEEEDDDHSSQSIQTIIEVINSQSPPHSNRIKDTNFMKVWATRHSYKISRVASLSAKLEPLQQTPHHLPATHQNHLSDSRTKTDSKTRDINKSQSLEVNSRSQQAVLSTRILLRLFLVTLFYCLCWLPFYLIELGVIQYDNVLIQTFFMANMVNPLIHLTTSKQFRRQFLSRLKKLHKRGLFAVLRVC